MSKTPPPGIKDPYGPGLTWDETKIPDVYQANQAWAAKMGYDKNQPQDPIDQKDKKGK